MKRAPAPPKESKFCPACGRQKPTTEFYARKSGKQIGRLSENCKPCQLRKNKAYYEENRDKVLQTVKAYREQNIEKVRTRVKTANKARYRSDKETVLDRMGRICVCCGETEPAFLTLDHVDGDGQAHRKLIAKEGMASISSWLVKNGFPEKPRLQILCYNCNLARRHYGGVCPHRSARLRCEAA